MNQLLGMTKEDQARYYQEEMSEMFFQGTPDFDEIMAKVAQIEITINSPAKRS